MRLTQPILIALSFTLTLQGPAETAYRPNAPAPQTAQSKAPTIQVYSRETVVDVTVTDDHGQPVHGLKQSDFTIEEDGKSEPLRSFHEFSKETIVAHNSARLPPNVYTNFRPAVEPLYILLLLAPCRYSLDATMQGKEAEKFVKAMAPGTQVAIFRLSCGLGLIQGPTSDKPTLLEALTRDYIRPAPDQCDRAVQAKNWIYPQQCMLEQLNQIASYVSGIKGRKNLLWISPGNPSLIFPDTKPAQSTRELLPDFTKELQKTYDLMAAAQVAIYPVDPAGVIAGRSAAYEHLSMEAVAEATGGEAFYNLNDLAALMSKAVEHGAYYYTLSYVPESVAYDGRYHSIKVKVDRPGVHVIYRKGYTAENTFSAPASGPTLMQVDMGPNTPTATQLLFDARVDPAPAAVSAQAPGARYVLPSPDKASTPYGVLFALPASQITFAAGPDGTYIGSLEFDVAAYGPKGKLLNLVSQTMKLPLTADEYQQFLKTPFQFFQQLDLPPGQLSLRVGILDGVSNKVGTLEIPVTVPKPTPAIPTKSP